MENFPSVGTFYPLAKRVCDTSQRTKLRRGEFQEPPILSPQRTQRAQRGKPGCIPKNPFFYVFFAFFAVNNLQYTKTSTAASCADLTTSSNFRSAVIGSLSLAETAGTDSRIGRDAVAASLKLGTSTFDEIKTN